MENFSVLLVDDEAEFLAALVKRLTKRGLNVHTAKSGEEALAIIKKKQIDVTVLDVRMPGLDGVQTLSEVKKLAPLIEVIMLPGHASIEAAIEGMELGAYDYLMKPADIDALFYKLQDAFKKRTIQQAKIQKLESLKS